MPECPAECNFREAGSFLKLMSSFTLIVAKQKNRRETFNGAGKVGKFMNNEMVAATDVLKLERCLQL